jgi:hypothetical protein
VWAHRSCCCLACSAYNAGGPAGTVSIVICHMLLAHFTDVYQRHMSVTCCSCSCRDCRVWGRGQGACPVLHTRDLNQGSHVT